MQEEQEHFIHTYTYCLPIQSNPCDVITRSDANNHSHTPTRASDKGSNHANARDARDDDDDNDDRCRAPPNAVVEPRRDGEETDNDDGDSWEKVHRACIFTNDDGSVIHRRVGDDTERCRRAPPRVIVDATSERGGG